MLSPRGVIRPLRGWLDGSGRWRGLALSIRAEVQWLCRREAPMGHFTHADLVHTFSGAKRFLPLGEAALHPTLQYRARWSTGPRCCKVEKAVCIIGNPEQLISSTGCLAIRIPMSAKPSPFSNLTLTDAKLVAKLLTTP